VLFLLAYLLSFFIQRKKQKIPFIYVSDLSLFNKHSVQTFPPLIGILALLCLSLFDPSMLMKNPPEKIVNNPVYLLLDQSGSMAPRFPLVKKVAREFIEKSQSGAIGLAIFARGVQVVQPLTSDREALLSSLETVGPVTSEEQDGTATGYALLKMIYLIQAAQIQGSSAVVIVTDGMENPSRLDANNDLRQMTIGEVAKIAAKHKVRVYIANIDPDFNQDAYGPERRMLKQVAEETQGDLYNVASGTSLKAIFDAIQNSENSKWKEQNPEGHKYSHASFGILLFAILCFVSRFLQKKAVPE